MSSEKKCRIAQVLDLSLDYVLGRQQRDGSWIDWKLPPGQSCIWATAYVGYRLRKIPAYMRNRTLAPMRAASNWLLEKMFADGGWGYSEDTGSDADSTSLTVLFLVAEGQIVPDISYSFLRTFQCLDGGFSTYRRSGVVGSWGMSHGDVTPSAIFALLTKYERQAETVERGVDYLIRTQTSSGIWESFWWTSFLYSTEASVALLKAIALEMDWGRTRETLITCAHEGAFDEALLLSSLVQLNPDVLDLKVSRLVDKLLQDQKSDGSWESDSILRVTRRDCFEPWRPGDSDALFVDTNRLFTTSTAIEALSRVYALL